MREDLEASEVAGREGRAERAPEKRQKGRGGEHAVLLTSGEGVHESGVWSRRRG